MRIALAYLSVVLLWSTTPLAIKWSGEGPGFLFGVTGRMVIGMTCIGLVLLLMRQRLAWHREACMTYAAAAFQIYGSMIVIYWAAQFIPSGWISVLFGLTPLMTALIASLMLRQRELTAGKLFSYVLGLGGLAIMFETALTMSRNAALSIAAIIFGTFLHSFSAVWIKRINAGLPALSQVAGGLLLSLPAYLLTWGIFDGDWPRHLSRASIASIVYLGVIATTAGFVLYYYLLTHLSATQVSLITLISPVLALLLGHAANHEPITPDVFYGTLAILSALLLHEYSGRRPYFTRAPRFIPAETSGRRKASSLKQSRRGRK